MKRTYESSYKVQRMAKDKYNQVKLSRIVSIVLVVNNRYIWVSPQLRRRRLRCSGQHMTEHEVHTTSP